MESRTVVTVRGLAIGGAGVADLPDGRVVFVPRTAPGDRVSIRIEKSRPRWASGSVRELVEPGEGRRPPLCALYLRCGGCQLQHIAYESQLEWKGRFVADALERIGGLVEVETPEVVPSPRETGYRSRVTFTLRRLRGGRVLAGFHALGRASHVVDVGEECVLPRRELVDAWAALRSGWGDGARLLPAGGQLRLTLRFEAPGPVLVVEGGPPGWRAEALARAVPQLVAVWHRPGLRGAAAVAVAGSAEELWPTAFAQVNPEAAAAMVEHVVGLAGLGEHAVDAYCGAGAFGRELAGRGWRVTGIERDPGACAAAREGSPQGLDVVEGPVEDHLGRALPADLLVVNPPRSGLAPHVRRLIAESGSGRLIYVSCDPATLARDVAELTRAYALVGLRCFDLFPQTAHVESVAHLASRAD
ncbi:MAG TPA: TRAM domain-containing protein [Longimicrobiales bacterium]|nr:TRAM domain-containing protein [Longimicrobiales bacterium]